MRYEATQAQGSPGMIIPANAWRRVSLAALTPDQAAESTFPRGAVSGRAGFRQVDRDYVVQAATSGQIVAFNPGGCTGTGYMVKPVLTSTASGLLLKFGPEAGPAAPFLVAAGAVLKIFGTIFAHHAQAVARERQVLCAAVPAANDALATIDTAVQSAQISPAQGMQSMDALLSDFRSTVAGIVKDSPSQCNAACVWTRMIGAIVAKKKAITRICSRRSNSSKGPIRWPRFSLRLAGLVRRLVGCPTRPRLDFCFCC